MEIENYTKNELISVIESFRKRCLLNARMTISKIDGSELQTTEIVFSGSHKIEIDKSTISNTEYIDLLK